jgi:CHAD domain-containing protein
MGTVLGAVRDADVMNASLMATSQGKLRLPGSDGVAVLRAKLAAERAKAVAGVDEALSSQRYLDLLDRLHAAASRPPLTGVANNASKSRRATKVMPKVVGRRWRRMKKKVAAGGESPSDEELHGIRIAAKNLRYASELCEPVMGKAAKKTAKLAENVQTVLGEYHDASALIDWLAQAGTAGRGRSGFAAGVLTAEQDRRRRKLAKKWRHQWAALSGPDHRRWLG